MDKKIIVLGDSFAEIKPELNYLWQYQISKKLKRDLVNIAHNGASSEWMMLKISEYLEPNLNKDDLLIVIVPFWERVCFWPDNPDFNANFPLESMNKNWPESTDNIPDFIARRLNQYSYDEKLAFQSYFRYLKDDRLVLIKTEAMINWVNNIAQKLKKKPLILDSHRFIENYSINLNNCTVAKGSLFPICEKEFLSKKQFNEYTDNGPFHDFRTGHFSECNHTVLADKIADYFLNEEIPDLNKDFYEKIIDSKFLKNLL